MPAPPWDRPADVVLRTNDHPQANGRQGQEGEHAWNLRFPLEDGRYLEVQVGDECFENFERMILQNRAATALERIGVH